MPPTMRFGVIGLGRAGSSMLVALTQHPDIKVTAAADLYQQHLDRFQADVGGDVYTDVEDLCKSDKVDAVYIATPHQFHAEHVQIAASYGKHIIVEKPMALTLAECDSMIEAAERNNVRMIVGHTASYNPAVQKMRGLINAGAVGRVGMISAVAYTDFMYRPRRPEELVTELGGGIMYNQVPHQVDATRFIAGGMARSVRAAAWTLDPERPTEGCYLAFLEFEGGEAASLVYSGYDHFDSSELATGQPKAAERYGEARRALRDVRTQEEEVARRVSTGYGGTHSVARARSGGASYLQPELGSFLVTCDKADLRLLSDGVGVYSEEGFKMVPPKPSRGVPGRGAVIDELYQAVVRDQPVVHDGRWAKATMEVCLAMLQSARERKEIMLHHQTPVVDVPAMG